MISPQINAKPIIINVAQVYGHTTEKKKIEFEPVYEQVLEAEESLNLQKINTVIGDPNRNISLGSKNERVKILIRFCHDENLVFKKTFYKRYPQRLYTCKSLSDKQGHVVPTQIDI